MRDLIFKLKNDKLFAGFALGLAVVVLYDLFVAVFDIIQFAILTNNAAGLFNSFSAINITAGVVNVLAIIAVFVYMIFSRRTLKAQIKEKTKSH